MCHSPTEYYIKIKKNATPTGIMIVLNVAKYLSMHCLPLHQIDIQPTCKLPSMCFISLYLHQDILNPASVPFSWIPSIAIRVQKWTYWLPECVTVSHTTTTRAKRTLKLIKCVTVNQRHHLSFQPANFTLFQECMWSGACCVSQAFGEHLCAHWLPFPLLLNHV